jgi:hypothetical protein
VKRCLEQRRSSVRIVMVWLDSMHNVAMFLVNTIYPLSTGRIHSLFMSHTLSITQSCWESLHSLVGELNRAILQPAHNNCRRTHTVGHSMQVNVQPPAPLCVIHRPTPRSWPCSCPPRQETGRGYLRVLPHE